jgi:hypothetical protein
MKPNTSKDTFKDDEMVFIDGESDFRFGARVDFSLILLRQLDRIAKSYSFGGTQQFIMGVNILKSLLSAQVDKRAKVIIDEIDARYKGMLESVEPTKRSLSQQNIEQQHATEIFNALIILMSRRAILPEKEIVDYGGVVDG